MKNIKEMTVKELREEAKARQLKGYGHMTKEELQDLILRDMDPRIPDQPYKEEEIPQKKTNGWEKIAQRQLTNAYNSYVGELENGVQDGDLTQEQIEAEIADSLDYVYTEAITTHYEPGFAGGPAPKEMRFATKEYCYKFLKQLYAADGYKVNDSKKATKAAKINKPVGSIKVELLAFTGMHIAEFNVELKDGEYLLVTANGTELRFDTNGKQLNAKNPKFGNTIKFLGKEVV